MNALKSVATWCLDLLFPKLCVGCRTEGAFCCENCRQNLVFSAPACPVCSRRNFTGIVCTTCAEKSGLRRFVAPFSYREPLVRELIHTYKYAGARELAGFLAGEIVSCLRFYDITPPTSAILIPIPLHRSRERARGFNQAAVLAAELGKRVGLSVAPALSRRRATDPQIEMESHDARRKNVANAFALRDAEVIRGRTVILVDDVSTSGATLSEAARLLRDAGARTVWAVAVAKG